MASSAVAEHIREVVATTFGVDAAEIEPETSNQTLRAWSSLAHLRLIANLERAFGIRFTMSEMTSMQSVQAIEQVLAARGVDA